MIKSEIGNFFCKFTTEVSIQLSNTLGTLLYRLTQLLLLLLIGYLMYLNASWNLKERGISNVFTNVEGVDDMAHQMVKDAIDFINPPQEKDAFFITTTVLVTEQSQGTCVDHDLDVGNNCTTNRDCIAGEKSKHGINTGDCDLSRRLCLIKGWCPAEDRSSSNTVASKLHNIDNFTVYIRNNIEFFSFKQFRNNYNFTKGHKPCIYNPKKNPLCPIFRIKDILKNIKVQYTDVQAKGAVIGIFVNWKCYFNWNPDPCTIKYTFRRLAKDQTRGFVGHKYKSASYRKENNRNLRTKITAYGLRFLVIVGSSGFQFHAFTLLSSIGSFLSYFTILYTVAYFVFYLCCFTDRQKRLHFLDDKEEPYKGIPLEEKASVLL